jgi:hypothetical protein
MIETQWIKKHGKAAQGKKEYIQYLEHGRKLPPIKAIKANCYQCMGSYFDGKFDCEIPDCPLYPFMPYREDKLKAKRVMTEKQQESIQKLVNLRSGARRIASGSKST